MQIVGAKEHGENTRQRQGRRAGANKRTDLPPGVTLFRTLEGHRAYIWNVAFDPQGSTLASSSRDGTVNLWEPYSGKLRHTIEEESERVLGCRV